LAFPQETRFVGDKIRKGYAGAQNTGITLYLIVRDQDKQPRVKLGVETILSLGEILERLQWNGTDKRT